MIAKGKKQTTRWSVKSNSKREKERERGFKGIAESGSEADYILCRLCLFTKETI